MPQSTGAVLLLPRPRTVRRMEGVQASHAGTRSVAYGVQLVCVPFDQRFGEYEQTSSVFRVDRNLGVDDGHDGGTWVWKRKV